MRTLICLIAGLALASVAAPSARAAEAEIAYIVTYFETAPEAARDTVGLMRQLSSASRKEAGNLRFEVLQRTGHPDQFAILEAWKDKGAQAAHAGAAHTKAFRGKLQPLLRSPYDERPHVALSVGPVRSGLEGYAAHSAIYAVTHVDIVPTSREVGIAMVKQLGDDGRADRGNVRFEALTQVSRTNHMTVVEIWPDGESVAAHSVAAHKKAFREKLTPMSGSLYDERFYRAVD